MTTIYSVYDPDLMKVKRKKKVRNYFLSLGLLVSTIFVVGLLEAFSGIYVEQPYLYCNVSGGGYGRACIENGTIFFNESYLNYTIDSQLYSDVQTNEQMDITIITGDEADTDITSASETFDKVIT